MQLQPLGPGLALLLALGPACSNSMPEAPRDMRGGTGGGDMRGAPPQPDMTAARDMPAGGGDMTALPDLKVVDLVVPPDLFIPDMKPATIDPKPTCVAQNVTATTLYPRFVANCTGGGFCHVGMGSAGGLSVPAVNGAAAMRTELLKDASFAPLKRVAPNDVDKSLLIYKLQNQQIKIANGGGSMPQGGVLDANDTCLFYNFVASGANL